MGRIEYEYPLFKVYYSNNSNNSNIRGNPALVTRPSLFMLECAVCGVWALAGHSLGAGGGFVAIKMRDTDEE